MAKSFVSAGVFTEETDASFLGPGVGAIGASLIGTSNVGPAMVPVTVTNFSEYIEFFGDLNTDHNLGYAARAYLKNSATANIVRVLGPEGRTVNGTAVTAGYSAESLWAVMGITGSATAAVHATIEITGSADLAITDLSNDQFVVNISGSAAGFDPLISVTASFLTSSGNYIKKVLNTDPTKFEEVGYYLRDVYDYAFKTHTDGDAIYSSSSFALGNFQFGFNSGSTSWLNSQVFGGTSDYNLFRVHTLFHGDSAHTLWKLSVTNIRPSVAPEVNEFGKFDLELRSLGDTDKSKSLVESYPNLSLDPKDPSYVCRVIGDKLLKFDQSKTKMVETGDYDNRSRRIRIEMTTGSFPDAALPWGFRGLEKPELTYVSGTLADEGELAANVDDTLLDLPLVGDLKDKATQAEVSTGIYWGIEFDLSGSVVGRLSKYSTMTGSDADFSLKFVSGSANADDSGAGNQGLRYDTTLPVSSQKSPGDTTSHTVLDSNVAKFSLPFAFGFDGFDRRLEDPLNNGTQLAAVSQLGTQALRNAVQIIADPDFIDINLLCIPGINSSKVVDYAIDAIEDRADAFYIADVTGSTVTEVTNEVKGRGFDTNYAGVYYPAIKVFDDVNSVAKELPASVAALGAMAFNDRVAYPWFAPAGLNRAGLGPDVTGFNVLGVLDQLKKTERDTLYEARINPIARFPDVPQGVIWGQKTLQLRQSALDRINVRRLLIRAKKLVASAAKILVFEPNNSTTQTRFRQLVNPILADIQQKQGLEGFKVVMDETTNPPELIDRNIMAGKILLIPTKATEFISIDFVVGKSGASFDE